jgi:glyoxylase-like metal-dependent hydrolase (beta-lactamase superfamily II)
MTLNNSNLHLGEEPGDVVVPLPAYLIEHDRGLVLVDTGLRPDAHDKDPREVYGDAVDAWPIECPPENRLDRQINNAGFQVEDITHVIVSHTHIDHVGGLYLFPQAEFYASAEDLRYAFWPHPFWHLAFGREDLERARSFNWNLLDTDLDLFGDGSIQILQTPGHTPGHMSVLLKLPSRNLLLAIDAGHTLKNIAGVPEVGDLDGITTFKSIQRIKQISAAHQAEIWVMHDAGQWEEITQATQPYS